MTAIASDNLIIHLNEESNSNEILEHSGHNNLVNVKCKNKDIYAWDREDTVPSAPSLVDVLSEGESPI